MFGNSTSSCPNGYLPYLDRSTNALSPCFLSLLQLSSTGFLIIIGFIQLVYLLLETKIPANFKYTTKWRSIPKRHWVHLSNILFQSAVMFAQFTIARSDEYAYPSITKYSLLANLFFILFISIPTQYLEYFKSTCSIGNQVFYYMFQILFLAFQIGQRLLHPGDDRMVIIKGQYANICEYVLIVNAIVVFFYDTCIFESSPQLKEYYVENKIFVNCHVLADITFTWMNGLINTTYRDKKIKDPHNLPLPPININIRNVSERLNGNWEQQKWEGKKSLFRAILKTFGKTIFIAILFETTKDILSVIEPQFLRLFINNFNTDEKNLYPPLNGAFVALALFISKIVSTLLNNQFYITIFEVGLGIRGSLVALVYQKSLRLSLSARDEKSSGDIINLMSVDVLRLQKFFEDSQTIIGAPIQIVIVLISLYWLLGNAVIGGIVTMAIMIPVNAYLSKRVKSLFKTQMKYKDTRIRTLTELLNSIKSIKLYAWEKPMLERLFHVRNDLELENFKKISIISNMIYFAWSCVPLMVTCSTFAIFSMTSDVPLTPEIVFPSLTLFNILNDAIYSVPSTINNIIEAGVSMNRLKDFLSAEELDDSFIEYAGLPTDKRTPVIEIENATFLWKSKKQIQSSENYDEETTIETTQTALENIDNFVVKKGSLTCIVGRVGSGKTTLLRAILGQLPAISGSRESIHPKLTLRASSVSYCPQEPWIMNSTVKENILFGHRFDETFYNLTLDACQLIPDLDILPDRDETVVGEKGISLSGGQKARLSLARAVYARCDVYLLDDVLSAVDAEVSKNIIEKVLDENTGLLKNKTVILTTNAVSVLKHSNNIYALDNCEIVEEGQYDTVMSSAKDSRIKKLIQEFGKNNDVEKVSNSVTDSATFESTPDVEEQKDSDVPESIISFDAEADMQVMDPLLRKASMATMRARPLFDVNKSQSKTKQQEETKEEGRVKSYVYIAYIKACGVTGVVLFFIFMILTRVFDLAENFWLKHWSESNQNNGSNDNFWMFVGVYASIGILSAAFNNIRSIIMLLYCSIRGSKKLHDNMANAVVRSPMSFFETTPIGRVINRFSSDLESVDSGLQYIFSFFFKSILTYVVTVILVGYNMPWFFAFNAVVIVIYFYYQAYYIMLSRELKRLTSISYSPIMSLVSETLSGYLVINAYDHSERFNYFNFENVQFNINCLFHFRSTNRWLSIRLQSIGAFIVLITGLLALVTIGTQKQLGPGMVGLLMSYSLQVTSSLTWIVRLSVQIETNIVSVERILEYCDLTPEAPAIIEENRVEENWPSKGAIQFKDYTTRYRENLDPVLKEISADIKPQEKIGIVGRTGAGKSTLTLALFRLIEATSGSIIIDGVDISKIGLNDLRSHLAIIPQDAQAFEGTVKSNLDPFNQYSDEKIWKAIELAHLKPHIEKIAANNADGSDVEVEGNDTTVTKVYTIAELLKTNIKENGSNLSVGQRQLLCLSRALLNSSKILVLDEATAAVDMETDKIIQETIRDSFADRTILTIAHRIDTVLGSDRIIVLDKGEIKEFDSPDKLLSDKNSIFYSLCEKGGYLKKEQKP